MGGCRASISGTRPASERSATACPAGCGTGGTGRWRRSARVPARRSSACWTISAWGLPTRWWSEWTSSGSRHAESAASRCEDPADVPEASDRVGMRHDLLLEGGRIAAHAHGDDTDTALLLVAGYGDPTRPKAPGVFS